MTVNYKEKYHKHLIVNQLNVLDEISSKEMEIKIANWASKFGFSYEVIKQKILSDEIFRCVFAKDPNKQNLFQKLAAEHICNISTVKEFRVLPSGGRNAIYLLNGKIFTGNQLKNQTKEIKSIDFEWKIGSYKFYASHKYTEISGGAQDNQYRDVQEFLKHARDCNEPNTILVAICDGNYYLQKDSSTGDETKLKRLTRLTDNKTTFVKIIDELDNFLKNFS